MEEMRQDISRELCHVIEEPGRQVAALLEQRVCEWQPRFPIPMESGLT